MYWQTLNGPPKPRDIQVLLNISDELARKLTREYFEKHPVAEEPYDFLSYKPGRKVTKQENKFDFSQISILQEPQNNASTNYEIREILHTKKTQQIQKTRPKFDRNSISKSSKLQNFPSNKNSTPNFYIQTQQTEMIEETPYLSRIDLKLDWKSKDRLENVPKLEIRKRECIQRYEDLPVQKFICAPNSNFSSRESESQEIRTIDPKFDKNSISKLNKPIVQNLLSNKNSTSNFYIQTQQTEMIEETPYLSRIDPKFDWKSKDQLENVPKLEMRKRECIQRYEDLPVQKFNCTPNSNFSSRESGSQETGISDPKFYRNSISKLNKPIVQNLHKNSTSNFYDQTQQTEMIEETPYLSRIDPKFDWKSKDQLENVPKLEIRKREWIQRYEDLPVQKFNCTPNSKFSSRESESQETRISDPKFYRNSISKLNKPIVKNLHKNSTSNFYVQTQQTEMIEETPYLSCIDTKFDWKSTDHLENVPKLEIRRKEEIQKCEDKDIIPGQNCATNSKISSRESGSPENKTLNFGEVEQLSRSSNQLEMEANKQDSKRRKVVDILQHFKFTAKSRPLELEDFHNKIGGDKDSHDNDQDDKENRNEATHHPDLKNNSEKLSQQLSQYENDWCVSREFLEILTPDKTLSSFEISKKSDVSKIVEDPKLQIKGKLFGDSNLIEPILIKSKPDFIFTTSSNASSVPNNTTILKKHDGNSSISSGRAILRKTQDVDQNISLEIISTTPSNHYTKFRKITDFPMKAKRKSQSSLKDIIAPLQQQISLDIIGTTPSNSTNARKITDFFTKAKRKSQSSLEDTIGPTKSNNTNRGKITDFSTKAKRKSQSSLEADVCPKQKRQKFSTPYKSQFQEVEVNYEIEQLKEGNCAELKRKILQRFPVEIAFDVIFSEGFCQLSKTSTNKLNGRPAGIILGIFWEVQTVTYYYLEVTTCIEQDLRRLRATLQGFTPDLRKFLLYLLSPKLTCRKICYDSKALFKLLLDLSLPREDLIKSEIFDLMVGTWLLNPETPAGSFKATQTILGASIDHKVASSDAVIKACHLIGVLSKFVEKMTLDLKQRGMFEVFVKIECRMPAILADMEFRGARIDRMELLETSCGLKAKIKDCESKANGIMGRRVSLNSTVDIKRALYGELKLNDKIKSPMKESTCERSLLLLKELHPLPSVVLSYRDLQRRNAGLESILKSIHGQTLHPIWDQTTATGRVMSRSPNLQAISEGNLVGFKAGGDYVLLAIDFSHVELRMFAHLAQDFNLLAFLRKENGNVFEKLDVGGTGRDQRETKKILYTLMQGMGPSRLSDALKVEADVARSIYLEFTGKFPVFKKFPESIINSCKRLGYVTSICGRRRNFPNVNNQNYGTRTQCEYQAINFCVQASTADFIKSAAIYLLEKLQEENLECHMVLVGRERLILEVSDEGVDKTSDLIQKCLSNPGIFCRNLFPLSCHFPVQIRSGKSWGDLE